MMSTLADFHFLRPYWLLALVPTLYFVARLSRRHGTASMWRSVCDARLLPHLLVDTHHTQSRLNLILFGLTASVTVAALAGPAWEKLPTPVFREQSALVIVLDLSRSMDAADVSPSRLERAKFKIADLLRQRRTGQTGLIVYAAEPYVVTPLTDDVATIENQLPALKTSIMPSQGSEPAAAIARAIDLLKGAGVASGDVLLITDGAGPKQIRDTLDVIAGSSMRLSVLGVGTREGAPIPDGRGGFLTDRAGGIVVEPLQATALQALAGHGRGLYRAVRTDDLDLTPIVALIDARGAQRDAQMSDLLTDRWREFGPVLLLAMLPLIPLAFRRGILTLLLAAGLSGVPYQPAVADWWLTADQAARRAFEREQYQAAAGRFEDPGWRGAANYRAGDFQASTEALSALDDPESHYNRGNALARLGQLQEAIAAYDETLAAHPEHTDAAYNKALLEELLKAQQQEQPEEEQSGDGDSEDQEDQQQSGNSQGDESDAEPQDDQSDADSAARQNRNEQDNRGQQSESSANQQHQAAEPETDSAPDADPSPEEMENEEQPEDREQPMQADASDASEADLESDQATEQWLRQIPDDPSGLLRRKFQYQYQTRNPNRKRSYGW